MVAAVEAYKLASFGRSRLCSVREREVQPVPVVVDVYLRTEMRSQGLPHIFVSAAGNSSVSRSTKRNTLKDESTCPKVHESK